MNPILFICFALLPLLGETNAGCPNIEAVPEFDVNGILGHWYTIQKTGTNQPCLTLNFTAGGKPDEYHVVETYQSMGLLNALGLQHENHLRGRLADLKSSGTFDVSLPLRTLKVTVIATDYDNYAAFLVCKRGFALVNVPWLIVSSRTPAMNPKHFEPIYSKLLKHDINPFAINFVKQEGCPQHGGRGPIVRTASGILDKVKGAFGNIANVFRPKEQKKIEKPEEEVQYDIDVRSSFVN